MLIKLMAGGRVVSAGVSGVDITRAAFGSENRRRVGQTQPRSNLDMQTVPMKSRIP